MTADADRKVLMSTRNLEGALHLPADRINTYEILRHRQLVLTVDAVRRIEALWGGERANHRRPAPAAAEGVA